MQLLQPPPAAAAAPPLAAASSSNSSGLAVLSPPAASPSSPASASAGPPSSYNNIRPPLPEGGSAGSAPASGGGGGGGTPAASSPPHGCITSSASEAAEAEEAEAEEAAAGLSRRAPVPGPAGTPVRPLSRHPPTPRPDTQAQMPPPHRDRRAVRRDGRGEVWSAHARAERSGGKRSHVPGGAEGKGPRAQLWLRPLCLEATVAPSSPPFFPSAENLFVATSRPCCPPVRAVGTQTVLPLVFRSAVAGLCSSPCSPAAVSWRLGTRSGFLSRSLLGPPACCWLCSFSARCSFPVLPFMWVSVLSAPHFCVALWMLFPYDKVHLSS